MERVRLRIGDLDFDHQQIRVWNGKGQTHRLVTMAPKIVPALNNQLGHADVKTTEIDTHVLNRGARGVTSPLSSLLSG